MMSTIPLPPKVSEPRRVEPSTPATLADILRPHATPFSVLKARYPFIGILQPVLGAVPNSLCLVEVFHPAVVTEHVIVPAMLGFPASLFGFGTDLRQAGLAMYGAARQSGCQYCTLHTCTMSLRRGLDDEALTLKNLAPADDACANLGRALGSVPCMMTPEIYDALLDAKGSESAAESIMLPVVALGWLSRVMDSLGLDMEEALVDEVKDLLSPLGWSTGRHAVAKPQHGLQAPQKDPQRGGDTFLSRLKVLKNAPSAALFDIRATSGVPGGSESVMRFLSKQLGHNFPVIGRISSKPARRAIAVALVKNSLSAECKVPLVLKAATGVALARFGQNEEVEEAMEAVARHADGIAHDALEPLEVTLLRTEAEKNSYAMVCDEKWVESTRERLQLAGMRQKATAVAILAMSASTAPVQVTPAVVNMIKDYLSPGEIIETISFLGCVSMLLRLEAYYAVAC